MKKNITIVFLLFGFFSFAQIAIGKNSIDGSGLIDFSLNATGGIVLPYVSVVPTGNSALNGTIIVNAANLNDVKIQAMQNGNWINLTDAQDLPRLDKNLNLDVNNGVILGNSTSVANGVLVLESTTKALILPKITNILTYENATVGTMLYDMATKSIAIYDGNTWVYWK